MRRILRQIARNEQELGDLSTLADPKVVEVLFSQRCEASAWTDEKNHSTTAGSVSPLQCLCALTWNHNRTLLRCQMFPCFSWRHLYVYVNSDMGLLLLCFWGQKFHTARTESLSFYISSNILNIFGCFITFALQTLFRYIFSICDASVWINC